MDYQEFKKICLQDPEFAKVYAESEEEYQRERAEILKELEQLPDDLIT